MTAGGAPRNDLDGPSFNNANAVAAAGTGRRRSSTSTIGASGGATTMRRTNSTAQFGGGLGWREHITSAGNNDNAVAAAEVARGVLKSAGEESSYGSDNGSDGGGNGGDNKSGVFTLDLSGGRMGTTLSGDSLSDGFGSVSERESELSSGDNRATTSSSGGSGSGSGKVSSLTSPNKSSSSSGDNAGGGSAGPFGRIIRPSEYLFGGGGGRNRVNAGGRADAAAAARSPASPMSPAVKGEPRKSFLFPSRASRSAATSRAPVAIEKRPSFSIGRRNFSAVMDAQDAVELRRSGTSGGHKQSKQQPRRDSGSNPNSGEDGIDCAKSLASSASVEDGSNAKRGRWRRMSITKRVCVAAVAVAGAACVTVGVMVPDSAAAARVMVNDANEALKTLVNAEEEYVLGHQQQHQEDQVTTDEPENQGGTDKQNRELDDSVSNSTSTNTAGNREMEKDSSLRGGAKAHRPHLVASADAAKALAP